MQYLYTPDRLDDLLQLLNEEDTVEISGRDFLELIRRLPREENRGRKPIAVDGSLFDSTVQRWQRGELTARQAMKILELKPNTFYRRVKERKQNDMKTDITEVRKHIHEGAAELRKDIHEIRGHLHEDAAAAKVVIDEKKQLLDMEREINHERIAAKLEHLEQVNDLRSEVAKEAEAMKKLAKEAAEKED